MPGWSITKANVLLFVVGGFLGVCALVGLAALIAPYLLDLLGIHGEPPHGEMLGYAVLVVGAELGGLGLVFLKSRLQGGRRRN